MFEMKNAQKLCYQVSPEEGRTASNLKIIPYAKTWVLTDET